MLLPLSLSHPIFKHPTVFFPLISLSPTHHTYTRTHTPRAHLVTVPLSPPGQTGGSVPLKSGKRMHCGLVSCLTVALGLGQPLSRRPCCWVAVTCLPSAIRPQGSVPAVQVPLSCRLALASASRARQGSGSLGCLSVLSPGHSPPGSPVARGDPQRVAPQGQASSRPG